MPGDLAELGGDDINPAVNKSVTSRDARGSASPPTASRRSDSEAIGHPSIVQSPYTADPIDPTS
jgi:hypothetical protein